VSLELIEAEVKRFLSTKDPEVLCIKGRWGVGKTYGWKKFFEEARKAKVVALKHYSYVSLFGLNSLDDLRYSIFEGTTSGDRIGSSPDEASFQKLINKGKDIARQRRSLAEGIGALFNRKGFADVLFKSAFLAVREQVVCLDDLERAGSGLLVRDVLGLASFLKEERGCKVVLLLNDKEHDEKDEFDRQLEKVADVTIVFDLTPEEAAGIALTDDDQATKLTKPLITKLGITNIRVIKKIERLAKQLVQVLHGIDDNIVDKAVATLVLAGWSVLQPGEGPPLEFLKSYNRTALMMSPERGKRDEEAQRHHLKIADYPFKVADRLDEIVIDGVASGFFESAAILEVARVLEQASQGRSRDTAFSRTWSQLYHGSLTTDDGTFLDALFKSAFDEAAAISPLNINGAVRMLREFGRPKEADELIARYIGEHRQVGPEFFDLRQHHFINDDKIDDNLRAAFDAEKRAFVDTRDPLSVLVLITERRGWNPADIALMAKLSTDDFERLFESLQGDLVQRVLDMVESMGQGSSEGALAIRASSVAALKRIGAKSPIRNRKVARFIAKAEPP
jgi:hypothetical protein